MKIGAKLLQRNLKYFQNLYLFNYCSLQQTLGKKKTAFGIGLSISSSLDFCAVHFSAKTAGKWQFRKQIFPNIKDIPKREPTTMKLNSADFDALFTPELKEVRDIFKKHNFELRIAGGAVRDLLMGKKPTDIDFATTATPKEMQHMFETEEIRMLNKKGERHGTVTCRINDKENFEITTLRIDVLCDGRHADVEWTTDWFLDANRRDLTINSLFLGLDGTVYDYFDGIKDLENRRVAFVGNANQRIQEDFLRILRYFRFYGRIANLPDGHEKETLDAIRANVDGLAEISGERIWSEFKKIVVGRFNGSLVRTITETGVAQYCGLPEKPNVQEFERVAELCADLDPRPMTVIPGLLYSEDQVYRLDARLKMSSNERVLGLFIIMHRENAKGKPQKFFQDLILDEGGDKKPEGRERVYELLKYLGEKDILENLKVWDCPEFPVNGFMIVDQGVKKGPTMKRVLSHLFQLWKNSDYKAKPDELLGHCKEAEDLGSPKEKKSRGSEG